ncbi:hypothetical protein [Tsuneonella mangrovi]|uniref:hypothetical protein n=1 Tax=Tsuneonella mangrovi TaxID=1982042 RepID=UPI0012375868|nr:hypothetical protein [Tsuneonella mangrovi]
MIAALAVMAMAPNHFYDEIKVYLACLEQGLPADMNTRDYQARLQIYNAAAARCQQQRQAAIATAVKERKPDVSPEQARQQAAQIIDDLSPAAKNYGN